MAVESAVSGQVGSRKDGSAEPDLAAQVRLAFANLNAILTEAGSSFFSVPSMISICLLTT